MPVEQAILQTCRERARPVLLTAVTAVLGVLPIAFGLNLDFLNREVTYGAPSTQWWIQLSTAIVFGLSFATILTLIVTPASLSGLAKLRGRWDWLRRRVGDVERTAAASERRSAPKLQPNRRRRWSGQPHEDCRQS